MHRSFLLEIVRDSWNLDAVGADLGALDDSGWLSSARRRQAPSALIEARRADVEILTAKLGSAIHVDGKYAPGRDKVCFDFQRAGELEGRRHRRPRDLGSCVYAEVTLDVLGVRSALRRTGCCRPGP